jgi:dTDP-6-deoxy-L-talose 4-dehydrogenase (NAD+)
MKILVTGATGFIGSHLIFELLKNKSYQIIATSRSINKAMKFEWFSKVKFIEYDFNSGNNYDLYNLFGNPDQIIHLAWNNLSDVKNPIHLKETLINHHKFIENMVVAGLKEIVVTGSCFEYGMTQGSLSEDIVPNPINSYGKAKDKLRRLIIDLKKNYNFTYKWIRIFYVYGERQSKTSLMHLLDMAIKNKDTEFNMSGGEQIRDFLHIDDAVRYITLISNQKIYLNQAINCCSGKPISIKNLVMKYLEEKNYSMKLNLGFYPYLDYEPMSFWGDRFYLDKLLEK